jgi:hypothetical protein
MQETLAWFGDPEPREGTSVEKGRRLAWLLGVRDKFGGVPTKEQLRQYAWDTLESGKVIPGYGHAVLRVPDPRFTAQMEFAKERFPDDTLVRIADMVFEVVPQVLKEQGKAFINLGLGVNEGIRRFKKKWGGMPSLPYEYCEYKSKGKWLLQFLQKKV